MHCTGLSVRTHCTDTLDRSAHTHNSNTPSRVITSRGLAATQTPVNWMLMPQRYTKSPFRLLNRWIEWKERSFCMEDQLAPPLDMAQFHRCEIKAFLQVIWNPSINSQPWCGGSAVQHSNSGHIGYRQFRGTTLKTKAGYYSTRYASLHISKSDKCFFF